jgi:hypothetical protein
MCDTAFFILGFIMTFLSINYGYTLPLWTIAIVSVFSFIVIGTAQMYIIASGSIIAALTYFVWNIIGRMIS